MRKTASAVGIVMIIMVFSRLIAFCSSIAYMTFFGVSLEMDIYAYAIQFPNIIFNSFGTVLSTIVIPIFAGYIGTGEKEKAYKFADNALSLSLLFAAFLTVLGFVLAPLFPLFTEFKNEGYDFAVTSLRIMFPVMIFYTLNYVLQGILQSMGRYNMPAFVSVPSSLAVISYVYILGNSFGVSGLLVATFVGLAFQGLILIPPVFKTDYRYKPSFNLGDDDIKKALRMIPSVLVGTSAYQLNMLFNITITANFKATVALLTFVQNLILYSVLAFVFSMTAVVFPKFTMLATQNDMEGFKNSVLKVLKTIAYFLFPATAGFIAVRHQLVNFLVGWGKITGDDVKLVSAMLAIYSIGIVGVGVKEIVDRAFYSLKDTKKPAINGVIVVVINIAASLIFMQFMGPLGIPLAYSISALSGTVILLYMLQKKVGSFGLSKLIKMSAKVAFSSLLMFFAVWAINSILANFQFGGSFIDRLVKLFIPALAGALLYFASTILMKVEEAVEVAAEVRNRARGLLKI